MLSTAILFSFAHFRLAYTLDYCEQIIEVTDQNKIPALGTGVANALSCLPSEANTYVSQLNYKFYTEYQKGLIICNDRIVELKLSPYVDSYA